MKMRSDQHIAELFKGSFIAFFLRIVGMILGFFVTLIVARNYGAETMGLFALSVTILNIFAIIGLFGFDTALVKFVSEYNTNKEQHLIKEVYRLSLGFALPLSIFLALILYLFSGQLSYYVFDKAELVSFLQVAAFTLVPFILLRINSAALRGMKQIKASSFFNNVFVQLIIFFVLSVVASRYPQKETIMWIQLTSMAIAALTSYIHFARFIGNQINIRKNILRISKILNVSFPMMLTSAMALIMSWSDVVMLGAMRSSEELGVYSVVLKLAGLTSVTLIAVNTISAPKFSEFYSKGDIAGLKKTAISATKLIFYSTLPIIILLLLFAENVLDVFSEKFSSGVTPLWILVIGQTVNSMSGAVGFFLNMTGDQKINMFVNITVVCLNIILNYILITRYGITGAAIATAVSMALQNILKVIIIKRKHNFMFFYIPGYSHGR
jgi:O-antigen/teichoic acid export membrane protein